MKDPGHFVSVKKENHEEASKDAISRRNSHTHSKTKKYLSKFITMHRYRLLFIFFSIGEKCQTLLVSGIFLRTTVYKYLKP